MPNGTYGGVRGRKTKVGRKLLRFPPTRFQLQGINICLPRVAAGIAWHAPVASGAD